MTDSFEKYYNKYIQKNDDYQNEKDIDLLNQNHSQDLQNGCKAFVNHLYNIKTFDVTLNNMFPDSISKFTKSNATFYYTGCEEFKNFLTSFNKQKNINIVHDGNLFVNKINVDAKKLKENTIHFKLRYESEYVSDINVPNITPNNTNTFFG